MAVELTTDSDFKEKIEQNEKVVVKYYADWCGSCRLFKPKYRRLSEDDRFSGVTFLDVNAENNPEARKAASVTNLPYFAVFKEGKLLDALASSKEESVVEMIQKLNH